MKESAVSSMAGRNILTKPLKMVCRVIRFTRHLSEEQALHSTQVQCL